MNKNMAVQNKSQPLSPVTAAILSVLPHSICCGLPILLIALGLGGLSASSVLSQYHTLFTVFGIGALGYGVYVYWRNFHSKSCSCHSCGKNSKRCAFCLLFLAGFLQVGMAAYFWRAASASPTVSEVEAIIGENQIAYKVVGIHCPGCAAEMEYKVETLESVESAKIVFSKSLLTITPASEDIEIETITEQIRALGYSKVYQIDSYTDVEVSEVHDDTHQLAAYRDMPLFPASE